ncbi:MAG: TIGR00730 family Rossman fold protein [Salinivirgaceae bacterium]|nr:TIGR00730 family Rossman fold protein [Salinivirgaceae bacterium]
MKTICVFCSSNLGTEAVYQQVAADLGATLAARGFNIVYGGANIGLMRCMAEAATAAGAKVTGVITEFLAGKHLTHSGLSELVVVKDMPERKAKMEQLSDGFIVLPGGFGTMDEMFEILSGGQLGFHKKPLVVLNINGFYNHLKAQLDFMVGQKMLLPQHASMVQFADTPAEAIDKLLGYQAPVVGKWIDDIRRDNGHKVSEE